MILIAILKYAVISDIHGNYHALEAVLNDAAAQAVDCYIFLGDYAAGPYPNEVIDKIRPLKNKFIIYGNGDAYFRELENPDSPKWTAAQFARLRWDYKTISTFNKEYLFSLPKNMIVPSDDNYIYLAHEPFAIFGKTKADELGGKHYALKMKESSFTHSEYLQYAKNLLNSDEALKSSLSGLKNGIYMFGHFHVQWHLEIDNKLLINPGSCGLPFDYDTRAPYTILCCNGNQWSVEERRVAYDIEQAIAGFENLNQDNDIAVWNKLTIEGMKTASNKLLFYLDFVEKTAVEAGDTARPYSKEIWDLAASKWSWDQS